MTFRPARFLLAALVMIGSTGAVWAACSNPTGQEGESVYNGTYHTLQFCNGTQWMAMGGVYTVPWQTSGTNVYYNGGNVGVGTANPAVRLEVNGEVSATNLKSVCFKVHKNGTAQTVVSGNITKLTWSAVEFDTNNNFSLDRFTPAVAGKYMVSLQVGSNVAIPNYISAIIKKNGSEISHIASYTGGSNTGSAAVIVVDMNGTTDYLEAYVQTNGTSIDGASSVTYFTGCKM